MLCAPMCSSARNPARMKESVGGARPADRIRLEASVRSHISRHFSGMSVPEGVDIHSDRYVDLCLSMDMCTAADMAYEAMARSGRFPSASNESSISEDVRTVIRVLRSIRRSCVPQELSAGILLMHLEIVEGLTF